MLQEIDYALPMILNIPVPQTGHLPFIAFLPFFIVVSAASFISLFDLHFTQYASIFLTVLNSLWLKVGFMCLTHKYQPINRYDFLIFI